MDILPQVPPGFRFHPTDEELVNYYLRKKVASRKIDLDVIKDVDLYKIEPWDLEEKCKIGTEEQNNWYFFSHKDKKYPTGTRTNRATTAGFWKATGRDKPIYLKNSLIGMRKTLVFYKGRAPYGQKSDWIMHEYRLETNENAPPQEEGWVVCRVFKKKLSTVRRANDHEIPSWYGDNASFMPDLLHSPKQIGHHPEIHYHHNHHHFPCKSEIDVQYHLPAHDTFLQLPQLESPKLPEFAGSTLRSSTFTQEEHVEAGNQLPLLAVYNNSTNIKQPIEQVTDWRVLDKFVASQLSHDEVVKVHNSHSSTAGRFEVSDKQESTFDYASTSTSSGQIDLWK